MTLQIFLSLLSYSFITAFTPGPSNILGLSCAATYGLKKSVSLLFGIFTGLFTITILCALFCYSLSRWLPTIIPMMKYVGAAYILWLAWHVARSRPELEDRKKTKAPSFFMGFSLQFLNIKIILYGITVMSGFILPYYESLHMVLPLCFLISLIGSLGTFSWTVAGALFQRLFVNYYRPLNIAMAILLLGCLPALFRL